jgi:uncharacterized RDD family membrane protein YckC
MHEEIGERLEASGLRLSALGRRTVAYMIDDTLISLLFIVMLWTPISQAQSMEAVAALIDGIALYLAMTQILYHTLFVWLYSASLGKMAMRMRVVHAAQMDRPTLAIAFNRAVFRVISGMIFYLGFLWAFFDPARRTWHDKTADTLVVDV